MKIIQKILNLINKAQKIAAIVLCVSEILAFSTACISKHFPELNAENTAVEEKEVIQ